MAETSGPQLERNLDSVRAYGQRLIVEPVGTELNAREAEILSELQPAGVMFRARNFEFKLPYEDWLEKFATLVSDIRAAIGRSEIILAIDHEGGRVVRPPKPVTRFPYARAYAGHADAVARAMATELKSLGINMNFAPVADIDEGCPVIKQRAFAESASLVSENAVAFAKALMEEGVAPVPKHFPGHGAATEDSHATLPVVRRTLAELREHELLPFRNLVSCGVPALMTAHLLLPEVDAQEPATTSQPILQGVLRDELGFDGVVIADALGMAAVSNLLEGGSLAGAGLRASLDLFMLAGDNVTIERSPQLAAEMREAFKAREVGEAELLASFDRIERLLGTLTQHTPAPLPAQVFEQHAELARKLDPNEEWANFQYIPKGFD